VSALRELVERVREARLALAASKQIFRAELVTALRDAEADLAEYVAAHPAILDAYEAIGALGHWRGVLASVDPSSPMAAGYIVQARVERDRAHESVCTVADRIHAAKGEG
jgi:hypothetical protein